MFLYHLRENGEVVITVKITTEPGFFFRFLRQFTTIADVVHWFLDLPFSWYYRYCNANFTTCDKHVTYYFDETHKPMTSHQHSLERWLNKSDEKSANFSDLVCVIRWEVETWPHGSFKHSSHAIVHFFAVSWTFLMISSFSLVIERPWYTWCIWWE